MEKFFKLFGAMLAMLALPVEQRDEKQWRKTLKDAEEFIESDEAKSLGQASDMKATFEQLKADHDKTVEQVRKLERMGLRTSDNRIVVRGRHERLEMLADNRAFMDDEMAKRFGAHTLAILSRAPGVPWNYEDLPQYTREIAEDVVKAAEAFRSKASPDISPDITGAGAELISAEYMTEMIRNLEAVGTAFTLCRRVPLTTMGQSIWPKQTDGLTAYPAAVAALLTQSGATFETVTMTPVKWATLTGIPGEMFRDPGILVDVGQFIGTEIVRALSDAFDNAVINGDGTATYGGITGFINSAGIATVTPTAAHTTVATQDATDVGEMVAGLTKGYALPGARWLMSLSVKQTLRNIRSTTGMPIYDRGQGSREPASIDGYPYTINTQMPAASAVGAGAPYAVFGDFRLAMYFGMLRNIMIDRSSEVWFTSDMVAIRGLAHVDAAEADSTALILAATHA